MKRNEAKIIEVKRREGTGRDGNRREEQETRRVDTGKEREGGDGNGKW